MSIQDSPYKADLLKDNVVLITGGSSGIGYEIAKQYGLHGCKVMIMGRRANVLQDAVESMKKLGIEADGVAADVRKIEDCKKAAEATATKFGGIDILVNCAAGNFLSPAEDLSANGFKTVIDIDVQGTFNASISAFPYLKKSKNANIINISAMLHQPATHWQIHASAAKAAIDSMTRTLALEWGDFNIRINGVAPGPIADTAGMTKLAGAFSEEELCKGIPVGRMGKKTDIAYSCIYLASKAGSYVSGHTVVVDGGQYLYRTPVASREMVQAYSRQIEKKSRAVGTATTTKNASKL